MEELSTLKARIEELEAQLKTQEKLASLGMLSAGIAHEIRNPLNFVINFSKMSDTLLNDLEHALRNLSVSLPKEEREDMEDALENLSDNLQKIREHGERAINIVQGILLYSRGKENEYVPTDAARLTKEYVWLAYHAMRANYKNFNISLHEEYEENLPEVKLIPQDFSRVILNVMNNACYAVWVKAQNASLDYQPTIKVELRRRYDLLVLTIEDNGEGMGKEVQQKLFEAFFTTKPVGQGTGLGMSIVKDIIENKHHGIIHFTSQKGRFTRFIFLIPMNL